MWSLVTWEELRVEPLLLHVKRFQVRCLFWIPPGLLPGEVFRSMLHHEETMRKPQDTLEGLCLLTDPRAPWGFLQQNWRKFQLRGRVGYFFLKCKLTNQIWIYFAIIQNINIIVSAEMLTQNHLKQILHQISRRSVTCESSEFDTTAHWCCKELSLTLVDLVCFQRRLLLLLKNYMS